MNIPKEAQEGLDFAVNNVNKLLDRKCNLNKALHMSRICSMEDTYHFLTYLKETNNPLYERIIKIVDAPKKKKS